MPRMKRRRLARNDLSDRTRIFLIGGHDFEFLAGEPLDPAEMRAAWETYSEDLLADFIPEHPGFRPAAYWRWSAPEPRREGESEPAYLLRHGLLTEGGVNTERRLAASFAEGLDDRETAARLGLLVREVADWRATITDAERHQSRERLNRCHTFNSP